MRANPEPQNAVLDIDAKCAVVSADADGMKSLDPLEMQRWMLRIRFEQFELLVSECLNDGRERVVAPPERGRRVMCQSLRERPA